VRVLDPGHYYELNPLDGESAVQRLQFVKREGKGYPDNVGHSPGTTSQEVLRVLIHRAGYVNNQIPCWQTRLSLYLMGFVVWLYEHRAAKRHKRTVPGLHEAVWGATCKLCGHVGCLGSCHMASLRAEEEK
jgi:hypothetical protein